MTGVSEPLGVTVCRLSLDPARGKLRHAGTVGVAVRAAMFAELAVSGRVIGIRWPEAVGSSESGNALPDAVHAAVARRRPTQWRRWYSHTEADREAAVKALLESGRWVREGDRIVDTEAGATLTEWLQLQQLSAVDSPPGDLTTTLLVLLLGGSGGLGRPAPRKYRKLAKPWLSQHLVRSGLAGDAALTAVRTGLHSMRRTKTLPFLSR